MEPIDLDGATLRIDSSAYFEPHVGVVPMSTKNHSVRNVSLDARTVDALRAHRSRMGERAELTGATLDQSAFVFSNDHDCSSPIVPDTFSRAWISLRDKAGLEHGVFVGCREIEIGGESAVGPEAAFAKTGSTFERELPAVEHAGCVEEVEEVVLGDIE